jgi:hypothetical protein
MRFYDREILTSVLYNKKLITFLINVKTWAGYIGETHIFRHHLTKGQRDSLKMTVGIFRNLKPRKTSFSRQ